ncbi:MAG TPA: type II toxin-antitoxin system VapC family toxin [Terriglobales bacterium]|nr:type II toxin-antitoxin system VapC family toxin [Terriglobales bacterium]
MTGSYVFDANAVLDFVEAGRGIHKIDQLLHAAARQQVTVLVSVMNLGEVFYWLWRKRSEEQARQTLDGLSRLPIQIVPVDLPQALKAGELKALHKIPYVDCIAAALALQHRATLVTADRDFEKLGRHFPVLWIPRP